MNINPSNQTKLYGHEDHLKKFIKLYNENNLPDKPPEPPPIMNKS